MHWEREIFLTVVVPAYKEEEYIEQTLQTIAATCSDAKISFEIIVVVDLVPEDKTTEYVHNAACDRPEIRVIERQGRRGVGDAIKTGIKIAKGNILIIAMGDQSEDPADIIALAKNCLDCDVVFTNRFKHGRPHGYPFGKYVANRSCNYVVKWLSNIPYTDTTNAFKAYKVEKLKEMDFASNGFEIFLEIPLKVMKLSNIRSKEIEVTHSVREKKSPKLSVTRDAYGYIRALFSSL